MTDTPKNTNGWTQERRARQAENIKRWKPWEKSTGPTSKKGKARSCLNALRDGKQIALFTDLSPLRDKPLRTPKPRKTKHVNAGPLENIMNELMDVGPHFSRDYAKILLFEGD